MTDLEKQNLYLTETLYYENIIRTLNIIFVVLIIIILYEISITNVLKKKILNMAENNKNFFKNLKIKLKNTELKNNEIKCTICYEKNRNVILYPCRHLVLCQNCSETIKIYNDSKCPLCRTKFNYYEKVFW